MRARTSRYEGALERFIADCDPQSLDEVQRIKRGFDQTTLAAVCRYQDAWIGLFDAILETIRAYRAFEAAAEIIGRFTDQNRTETEMLRFEDYYAGSGRANIEGGFYLVMPTAVPGEYRAQRSNGKEWVWEGGYFDSLDAAEAACQRHYEGGE